MYFSCKTLTLAVHIWEKIPLRNTVCKKHDFIKHTSVQYVCSAMVCSTAVYSEYTMYVMACNAYNTLHKSHVQSNTWMKQSTAVCSNDKYNSWSEKNAKHAKKQPVNGPNCVCGRKKYLFTESHDLTHFFFILKELL